MQAILVIITFILPLFTTLGGIHVPDNDLKKFSEHLFTLDSNNAGRWIRLDLQKRTHFNNSNDEAPNILFHLKREVFTIPTVSRIIKLYDNYELNSFHNEVVTNEEKQEETTLLETILNTSVMNDTKLFLQSQGLIANNNQAFKKALADIWFTLYSRGRNKIGSSAFEHIFLAELKNQNIAGLHNWLYFSYEENLGHVNYLGWLKKLEFPSKVGSGVIKLKYSWGSSLKHSGSLFIGTSPELEMALYTVCFLARPNDKCHISIDGKKLYILY